MNFANPLFLIGFTAVLLPIIIHLFNFRRYKTFYFSNVKMLQDIMQKTRRESQLQHWIVLIIRILGISFLVLAFAQPYIPSQNNKSKNGNLVSIFLDNSFSMDANTKEGTVLYDAVDAAKHVVNAFSFSDDFVLTTQDFNARESHILNKDEILNLLDGITPSHNSKTLKDIIDFSNNTAANSHKENKLQYFISDFQKNGFDFSALPNAKVQSIYLLPLLSKQVNNVSIDSCWFLQPVFKVGKQVTLTVRIHNFGTTDVTKLPVKLTVNNEQKAIAAIDLKANTSADIQMNYSISSEGTCCGVVSLEDSPITFDDKLYFVYQVAAATNIIAIQENSNRYLDAMYGKDSLFVFNTMNVNKINYSLFKTAQLIILDQVQTLSSGLSDELVKFVNGGGSLLVFPHKDMQINGFNNLFSSLDIPFFQTLEKQQHKVGRINYESPFFSGVVQNKDEQVEMPVVLQYYSFSPASAGCNMEVLMQLENGASFLSAFQLPKGKVFLSAVALNDDFGSAQKHALFFVPLHNIAIMSVMQNKLYNVIGVDESQTVSMFNDGSEDMYVLVSQEYENEFIPEQRKIGNEMTFFFHDQVQNAGFYDVNKGKTTYSTLAFNYDRGESDLSYYSENEIFDRSQQGDVPVKVIQADAKDLTKSVSNELKGTQLWYYCLIFSLLCFLAEILVLRFWGKFKAS